MDTKGPLADVAVIVPNWNGAHYLARCLDAVSNQTLKPKRTIVVDNGSTDDSVSIVRTSYPWADIIELCENRGFAAAVNAGIAASACPLVAALNNDTVAQPTWLETLVVALLETPGASFAASKVVLMDDPNVIDSAGHTFTPRTLNARDRGRGQPAALYRDAAWVFGAPASAALYRRALFDDIGVFDEDFFFSYEDVDVSLRATVAGHRCLFVPGAVVHHRRSSSHDPTRFRPLAIRNRIWLAGRSLPGRLLIRGMVGLIGIAVRDVMGGSISRTTPAGGNVNTGAFRAILRQTVNAVPTTRAKRSVARPYRRLRSRELMKRFGSQALRSPSPDS